MKTFTVHARPDHASPDEAEAPVLVKEGFSWLALLFPLLWLLFNRMWLVLLGWLAVGVAIAAVGTIWPATEGATTILAFVFAVWFAFEANGFRRWSLTRKGLPVVDVVAGRDRWEAERGYYLRAEMGAAAPSYAPRPAAAGSSRATGPVVGGLFPEARR